MIPLEKFRMGYVILYKNDNSFFGNAIVKKQLSAGFSFRDAQVTHTEISGGEKHAINISPPISKLIDITLAHKGRYAYLLRYKNEEYEKALRYKVAYFSAALCSNKPYDIGGVLSFLSFLAKWVKQDNRLYFCSEGGLTAFQMVFAGLLGIEPGECMPAHYFNEVFELVWEGIIK